MGTRSSMLKRGCYLNWFYQSCTNNYLPANICISALISAFLAHSYDLLAFFCLLWIVSSKLWWRKCPSLLPVGTQGHGYACNNLFGHVPPNRSLAWAWNKQKLLTSDMYVPSQNSTRLVCVRVGVYVNFDPTLNIDVMDLELLCLTGFNYLYSHPLHATHYRHS